MPAGKLLTPKPARSIEKLKASCVERAFKPVLCKLSVRTGKADLLLAHRIVQGFSP